IFALSTVGAGLFVGTPLLGGEAPRRTRMGLVTYALGIHQKNSWGGRHSGLTPAMALLEEAHDLGAAGIQVEINPQDLAQGPELRRKAEGWQMYIEASFSPPKSADDVERFDQCVRAAQAAGATLARTVIMPGRRYEQFKSIEEFHAAERAGLQALQWADPVLVRRQFRLAVENHKDQRISEKLATLKQLGSDRVGLCVDVGNSFTLMEDPLEVARAYAPFAFSAHFKDQAVQECFQGFLFADLPLGKGFLDLAALSRTLLTANPALHLNLELITRDPLVVPVFDERFWVTMPDLPARDLARVIAVVKNAGSRAPFPVISQLPVERQLAMELDNVTQSLTFARDRLGMI
ncbi:MAG TPA: TIM barrel protein, partial [Verrucomicrobiae bacterium]|nr:TIM barrel protein [Verrucomicrobiae bacterium]